MEGVKRSSKELRENTSLPRKLSTQTSTANVSSSSRPVPPKAGLDTLDSAAKDMVGRLVEQVNTSFKESTIEVIGMIEGSLQRFLADLSSIRKKISQSKIANPSVIVPEALNAPPVVSSGTVIVKDWNKSGVSSPRNPVKIPTPGGPAPIIQPARAPPQEEKEKKDRESRDKIDKLIKTSFDDKYQRPLDNRQSSKYIPQLEQPPQMATRRTRGVVSLTGGTVGTNPSSGTVLVTGSAIPSRRSMANLQNGTTQGQTSSNQGGLPRPARKTSRRSQAKARESSSEKVRAVGSSLEDADSDKSDRGRKLIVKANDFNNQKKRGRKPRAPSEVPISLGKRVLPKAKPDSIIESEVKETEKPIRKEVNITPKEIPQKEMKESKESQKAEPLTIIRETKEPLKEAQSPAKSSSQRRIAALPKETPDRAAQEEPSVAIIPNPSRMALISSILPEQNIPAPRTASMSLSLQNRRKQIQKENEELSRIEESCKIELAALSKPFKPSTAGAPVPAGGSEGRPPVDSETANPQNQNVANDSLDPTAARRRLKKTSKTKGGNEEEDADQVVEDMTVTKENLNVGTDNLEDSIVINMGGRPKIGGMARRSKPSSQVPAIASTNSTQTAKSLLNLLDHNSSIANSTLGASSTDATSIGATQVPTDDELAKRKPQHYTLEAFFYKQGAAFKPTSSISKDPSVSKIKPEKFDARFSGQASQAGVSATTTAGAGEQQTGDQKVYRPGLQTHAAAAGPQEAALAGTQSSRRSNSSAKGPNGLAAPVRETQELSRILDLAGLRK